MYTCGAWHCNGVNFACCAPIRVQLELLVLLGLLVSQAVKEIAAPRVLQDPQGILEALELPVRIM